MQIVISGGIVGTGGESNTNVTNCYYLAGTYTGAVNLKDIVGKAESRTEAQMKADAFVQTLNSGNTESEQVWAKDVDGKNGGYPILK